LSAFFIWDCGLHYCPATPLQVLEGDEIHDGAHHRLIHPKEERCSWDLLHLEHCCKGPVNASSTVTGSEGRLYAFLLSLETSAVADIVSRR
ncbi:hypothetical protein CLOP_g2914, partial [Closterium sp. NIES-67]